MSVINQMLNQLEQRGVHTVSEQTLVRAVPHSKRSHFTLLLSLVLVLAVVIAVWQWMQARKQDLSSHEIAAKANKVTVVGKSGNMTPQPAVPLVAHQPDVIVANLPASRLSFELSSVPLPSAVVQDARPVAKPENAIANRTSVPARSIKKAEKSEPEISDTLSAVEDTANEIMPMKQISPAQKADAEFRKAVALMKQGRTADALAGYKTALRLDEDHDAARQALVALLLENKRGMDAEQVLQERLKKKPDHTGFAMLLARLQVERGADAEATITLEKALPYAIKQADYQAFLAAVLQRQNRNEEAILHYQVVLQLTPGNGIWQMGYGISLQALQRIDDARAAYQRALASQTLTPELQAYVKQKLAALPPQVGH